jgi:hypothetical protein
MRSQKGVLAAIAVTVVVFNAVVGLIGGASLMQALLRGAISALFFVPIFWLILRLVDRRHRRRHDLSDVGDPPSANAPICVTATVNSAVSLEAATREVERRINEMNGRMSRTPATEGHIHVSANFGSRLALRFFGVYMSAGRRRLPIQMNVELRNGVSPGVQARIEARSDEGAFLYRMPALEAEYRRSLNALVAQVREALGEQPPSAE